jgi:hypothetical protein
MFKKIGSRCAFILFFLCVTSAFAQLKHTRLLYNVPLISDTPNDIGVITATGGEFSAKGWTPKNSSAQLRVECKSFLPFEGTMEVTVRGMMPTVNNEWIPIALYSRGDGSFDTVDPSPGSYAFLKTDQSYAGSGLDFKFFSSYFYGSNTDTPRRYTALNKRTWDPAKDYKLSIVWDRNTIKMMLGDEVLAEHKFTGQMESFGYIFLGRDDTYRTTMTGVYYRDLKIWGTETSYPFTNIARPYQEVADKKIGAQGVGLGDMDNNGSEDFYISRFMGSGIETPNLLYMQTSGAFTEESATRNVADLGYSYQSLTGDFDGDGDQDLFVVNFYRTDGYANQPNHLYLNNGTGSFTDATANLSGNVAADGNGGTLIDIDKDGDLDIVVVDQAAQHKVYVNDGKANFVVQSRGLENFRSSSFKYQGVTAGDLDGDGFQDLVLVHDTGIQIAKNNGSGTFVSGPSASITSGGSSAALCDIDNDADLDILVASKSSGRVEILRNDGNMTFTNISSTQQISVNSMGVLPGDWNNDGKIDLFLIDISSTGKLYLNDGSSRFTEKLGTGVEAVFADGRGSSTLDVNGDGRLDIYALGRGGQATDAVTKEKKSYSRNYLFRNDIQSGRNYLQVKVVDQNGNLSGLGAKIFVYRNGSYNTPSGLLGYREILSSNGFKSQSSLVQHFGLDAATSVDVKVLLPNGVEQKHTNVPVNQVLTIYPKRLDAARLVRDFSTSQPAVVGQAYEIAYKVLTSDSEPVPGHPVIFTITAGEGSLDPATSVLTRTVSADENGRARVDWILGPVAGIGGSNQIRANSENNGTPLSGSPDLYDIIASGDVPSILLKSSGDAQTGFVSEQLAASLVARVTDKFGNPIVGHTVEFTIATGGGKVKDSGAAATQVYATTDSDGNARVNWILGSPVGMQSVYARASYSGTALQNSPLTFIATAQEPLRKLLYVSGDRQSAAVNTDLPNPLRVRLLNADNTPIAGEIVRFKAVTLSAKFIGNDSVSVLTDTQGYAGATPTLGNAAGDTIYVFEAHAQSASGSPVIFKASAISGPPTKIVYVSGNNQTGPAGRVLPAVIKVRLQDNLDNPVKNYDVQFNVTQGDGSFNGQASFIVKSDAQGYAAANWRLGDRIGKNIATAASVGTQLPQITFNATGVVGPAGRLTKNGGDNQKGEGGSPLNQYFVVSVTDSFYNAIYNHPVTFRVTQGGGTLNGRTEVTEYTNVFGQAQVLYTMGAAVYEQKVEAAAFLNGVPLLDSPQVFRAVLGAGEPESVLNISGNNQIGRVNAELTEPFVVRVVDKDGIGVPDLEVEFVSFTQGASFSGETSLKRQSDNDGFARATATLGSNYGTNNYVFEVMARYNSKNLKNSPIQFHASGRVSLAKKMRKLNGEQLLAGTVGQTLSDSLQVLVLDNNDRPVANHPVTFQVIQGAAFIGGQNTSYTANSNGSGVASAVVKLATAPGASVVRASSNDGVNSLSPAFLDFNLQANVGAADAAMSSITATNNVLANPQVSSQVVVKLRDRFNNPIVNQSVTLQPAGLDVFVTQPALLTDADGVTRGSIASINIGKVMIYALVNNQPVVSTEIEFIAGPPAITTAINTGQSQEKGKTLPLQVGVLVQDAWTHPVKNLPVRFTVIRGGGSIAESQPIYTTIDGKAMVTWTLGDTLSDAYHEQTCSARIEGVAQPVLITAYALPPSEGHVRIVSGDSLIANANTQLPAAFRVAVTDKDGKPITNFPVEFSIVQGQGSITSVKPTTNQQGEAQTLFTTGAQLGLHIVKAAAGDYGSVFFNFMVQDKRTVFITKLSQDGRQVRPKTELALSLRVFDAFNRPINDEKMTLTNKQGQGYIKETMPLKSSADGLVTATWVTGTMGTQQVEVKAVNAANAATFFTAIVINSAPSFSPPLQKNRSVESGILLLFQVKAVDPDGDQVYYSARNMPQSAEFDADATQTFKWTPTNAQAGDHTITFVVMDQFGAADSSTVKISVSVRNQPPQIQSFTPTDTVLVVQFNTAVSFSVQALDPDNDPLSYTWTVISSQDEVVASETYELPGVIFSKQAFPDSSATIRISVSDGYSETVKYWWVHMSKTAAVELENFSASVRDDKVELVWKTKSEKGTAGFDVLRSRSSAGPFDTITPQLIAPQSGGSYTFTDEKVRAGERWFYKLRELDVYGLMTEHGLVEIEIALPTEIALRQNYPNPFNPTTTIRFELPVARSVKIVIFNMTGQAVRTLVDGDYTAGIHQIVWDAKDDAGQTAPSGIYYFRMATDGFSETKKLLLLK